MINIGFNKFLKLEFKNISLLNLKITIKCNIKFDLLKI